MKIVVDIFGGDKAPEQIVKGCIDVLNERDDLVLIMTGDEKLVQAELDKYTFKKERVNIVHAPEIITNDDAPTTAIKQKKESSLVKAFDLAKADDNIVGILSAGSTGAVLTGSVLKVGRIKGVIRPALAPLLPTITGGDVCLVDCGANVDCRPEFLVQFALMGISYMRSVHGIENPRVGLVSLGVEDKKGNELTKEVFKLLSAMPINFAGNMEARDALSGDYDVLVADGFVGNVLLKTVEGTAQMVVKKLKQAIYSSTSAKIGSLFMKKAFKSFKAEMDYNTRGGAPFLGVDKIVVKSHGSSNDVAISAALRQVIKMSEGKLIENIKNEMAKLSGENSTDAK